jgi:inner membrane protein
MFPLAHIGFPLLPFFIIRKQRMDYRLLFLGALLPDLIDKPLGHLILPENNGRIIGHTLLFSFIFLMVALFYKRFLPLSLGISFHQLLDFTFLDQRGSLWPFLGGFETTDFELTRWYHALTEPVVISGEIIGLSALIGFIIIGHLYRPDHLKYFLRTGNLGRG